MLAKNNQSPTQWVIALLISNLEEITIDAGTVKTTAVVQTSGKSMPFFVDIAKPIHSDWSLRGIASGKWKEYVAGSVVTISCASYPVLVNLQKDLKAKNVPASVYIKEVLRRHIKTVESGESIPPDYRAAERILKSHRKYGKALEECMRANKKEREVAPVQTVQEDVAPERKMPKAVPIAPPISPEPPAKQKNALSRYIS